MFLLSSFAFAINGRTTYQAKIYKPDGLPLESVSVNFRFTVLDPSSSCVLYIEDYAAVNMIGSGGLTSFSLGMGTRSYPASGPTTFANVFDNSTPSFVCQSPGVYNPVPTDNRKIVMQFNDGAGWQTLPAMAINSVPYAMYAAKSQTSEKLNGKADTSFVEYSTLASLNCQPNEAIKFNGATFACISVGSGVTSASVTAALGYTPADASTLSSSYTTQTSFTAVTASVNSIGASVTTLATQLNATAASMSAITSSQWTTSATSIFYNGGYVGVGTSAPTSAIGLNGNTGQTIGVERSDTISGQSLNVRAGGAALGVADMNGGPLFLSAGISTGMGHSNIIFRTASGTVSGTSDNTLINRMVISGNGNIGVGTNFPSTKLEVVGGLKIGTESASCAASLAGTLRYNGASVEYCNGTSWSAFGVAGAGITNMNGSTSGSQTFATGTAGASFNVVTAGSVHTFNIPLASAASVTGGLISNADYTTFSNKLAATSAAVNTALGYTAANQATVATSFTTVGSSLAALAASATNLTSTVNANSASISAITSSQWTTNGSNIYFTSGSVGVGTSAPAERLTVGAGRLAIINTAQWDHMALYHTGANAFYDVGGAEDGMIFRVDGSGGAGYPAASYTEAMRLMPSGRVGIGGVSNPTFTLEVSGAMRTGNASGSSTMGSDGNAYMELREHDNNGTPYIDFVNDNVTDYDARLILAGDDALQLNGAYFGIGVLPTAGLTIGPGASSYAPLKFTSGTLLASPQSGTMEYDGFNFYLTDGANQRRTIATGSAQGSFDGVSQLNSNSNLTLNPTGSVVVSSSMQVSGNLTANGSLGVGQANPGEKLDVNGNMRIGSADSNYIAFHGTTQDGGGSYNHTYIGERIYAPTESSELFLFKGNDSDNASGPDRIRMAGGNIVFDTYNTPDAPSGSFEAVATSPMISTKMIIKGNGNVGIGQTSPNYALDVSTTTSIPLRLQSVSAGSGVGIRIDGVDSGSTPRVGYINWSPVAGTNQSYFGFINQTGTNLMSVRADGNVGIGTTNPTAQLTTTGDALIGSGGYPALYLRDSFWWMGILRATDTSWPDNDSLVFNSPVGRPFVFQNGAASQTEGIARMYIDGTNGNVGIGTTAPVVPLHVFTSANANITVQTSASGAGGAAVNLVTASTGGSPWQLVKRDDGYLGAPVGSFMINNSSIAPLTITSAGVVGVNTTNPQAQLDVNGSIRGTALTFPAPTGDPAPMITARTVPAGQGASNEKTELILFHTNDFDNGAGPDQITLRAPALSFQTYNDATVADINNPAGYNERMYITPTGLVGVGTVSPTMKFQVADGAVMSTHTGTNTGVYMSAHSNGYGIIQGTTANNTGTKNLVMQEYGGNVGIGTSNPTTRLEVAGGDINVPTGRISFNSGVTTGTAGIAGTDNGGIFGEHDVNSETSRLVIEVADNQNDQIVLRTNAPSGGANVDMVKVQYDQIMLAPTTGNVGIGVATPTSKLQVNGGIKQPNYGVIWVTFDGTTRIVSMPAFLSDAYMNAHQDETFTWRAGGPTLKDSVGCNAGPHPNYQFNNIDSTWGGTYRMTIGNVNGTNVVDLEWSGWGINLLDGTFSVIPTNSNEGSVHATLANYPQGWTVEHMGGQVGATPFACH